MDPSCGDGVFVRHAPAGSVVSACEVDPVYVKEMRKHLPAGRLVAGDALVSLEDQWGTFDLAVGNPPYSAQAHLEARPEVLRMFELGEGRRAQCLEVLFIELFLKLVKPGGRIAVVLPDGPFSNRPFRYVRAWLLRHAEISAIISLPRNIFPATAAKTNVLLARRLAPGEAVVGRGTWLFQCDELKELETLEIPKVSGADPRWKCVQLTETDDWRPEAHAGSPRGRGAGGGGVRLGEAFSLRGGFALYGGRRELFEAPAADRIFLIRAKNIAPEGGLRLETDGAYIRRESDFFREKAMVRPGEILFVGVGVGCFGRAAVVPPGLVAQVDDWIHVLTPVADVDVEGVVRWFHSAAGRAELLKLAKGVGTLSISKASLRNLVLPAELVRGALPAVVPAGKPVRRRRLKKSAGREEGDELALESI